MKTKCLWFGTFKLVLFTVLVLGSEGAGTAAEEAVNEACQALQEADGISAFIEFASDECRDSVLPVIDSFNDILNTTVELGMAAAAVCIPACQSLISIQTVCLGQETIDNGAAFFCGRNTQGQACYEAFRSNNGSRANDACRNEATCTASCRTELQDLIAEVGCCIRSSGYFSLLQENDVSFIDNCGLDRPDFCPHLFNSDPDVSTAVTEACQALQEVRGIRGYLEFADEECRNAVLPVTDSFNDILNTTVDLRMAAEAVCIPACQSLITIETVCLGQEVIDNGTAFFCGRNAQGEACYEAFRSNDGSRANDACMNEDTCTASCRTELQDLVADVGCCFRSTGYIPLQPFIGKCGLDEPDSCPTVFDSDLETTTCPTATDATTASALASMYTIIITIGIFFIVL